MKDGIIRIGTDPDCEILIQDRGFSGVHALMYLSEGMLCMELLNGNMAVLNGYEVTGKYWLQQNDELLIGDIRLNLDEIYALLSNHSEKDQGVFYQDNSDAVIIKRNWWGILLVVLIVLGVMVVLGARFMDLRNNKKNQEKIQSKCDSIISVRKTELDSISQSLEQFE